MKPIVGLLAVVVALAMAIVPVPVWAEDPPPPAVGAIILEDDLLEPTLIRPFTCRTQRGGIDFVGEGLRMKLAGACNDGEIFAGTGANLRGLTIADGEVRVDIKPVSGVPLVRFNINVRGQPFTPGALNSVETVPASYAVAVEPGHGRVLIGKVGTRIIERSDLAEMIPGDDWTTVAIRLQGPNFWLLLNDQPVHFFTDDSLDRGLVTFGVLKMSNASGPDGPVGPERSRHDPNDGSEVAVVTRNLRVSALAEGDPARVPVYQSP